MTGSGLDDPELKAAERAEIRSSWLRCLRSGLRPEAEVQVSRAADTQGGHSLLFGLTHSIV
jgi:hypothetical protein